MRITNHPARVTVYNLHRPSCHWARSGSPERTTLADYAVGTLVTRADVPESTGWVYGRGSSGGDPHAPAWVEYAATGATVAATARALRLTCGHCMKGVRFNRTK